MTPKSDSVRQAQRVRAIACLLSSPTIESAASAAGISSRTMSRMLADETFQTALHDASQTVLEHTTMRLVGMSACAVSVFDEVMSSASAPMGVRTRAADLALANALRFQEAVSLAQRVKRLEQASKGGNHAETPIE